MSELPLTMSAEPLPEFPASFDAVPDVSTPPASLPLAPVPVSAVSTGPETTFGALPVPATAPRVRSVDEPSVWTRLGEELLTWFKTLASAAVYATLIVTFICQVARVEGQSMAPTLENNDRLIVNKLAYRIGEPRRNDIVMLYYPPNPERSYVKRVIAEPGDEVHIVDGRVYVNDVPLNDQYVPDQYRSHDNFGPKRIRDGYYFVLGDHRNNSSDSRHWGEVPKKYIIGKVQLRWWPLPTARMFE